ncbi:MAG: efflux RND transporter periplasmic adaptor subunit [Chloroflexi bacterium]|nr:efflux RND transporter periplasmic adaptor subunit [Chloroflexota bacterium]
MRRLLSIAFVVAAIGGTWWLYTYQQSITAEPARPENVVTEQVIRGPIEGVVSATGSLLAERQAVLSAPSGGKVVAVYVAERSLVAQGELLYRLDSESLELNLAQAEAALQVAEAQLARSTKRTRDEEIAAAQAALASAHANLRDLRAGASERDIELARLAVDQAKNSLWGAQANRDAVAGNRLAAGAQKDQAEAQVLNAEVAVQIAQLRYEQMLEPPKDSALASAQAQVAQAGASLMRLAAVPEAEDVALAQAQVEQARASVDIARARLDDVEYRAPFTGTLATWNVHGGDTLVPGAALGTLVDNSRYHINVYIDEIEIARLKVGQTAHITLDAFPDRDVEGRVASIDLVGNNTQGIVTYGVRIDLGNPAADVRPLMTTAVEIVVERKDDALLVPNRALRRDREGIYVEVLRNNVPTRAAVETGIRGEEYSEVLSGLEEGQEVIISRPQGSIFSGAFGG